MKIFVIGATGVIGRSLVAQLLGAGYDVTAASRSAPPDDWLAQHVDHVTVDAFDAEALTASIQAAGPDVVIDQLTDLAGMDPDKMEELIARNARLRREGTTNLVQAVTVAGVKRLIVQSISWAYASGDLPHGEADPLDLGASGTRKVTVDGVAALEDAVLGADDLQAVILRYGQLYGPRTGKEAPDGASPVHVDAAANAALLAVDRGSGIYNVTEPNAEVTSQRAQDELGWDPSFRWSRGK